HLEAVVVLRIVAAGDLDAAGGERVGREVQHGRRDHADIDDVDAAGDEAAHERSGERRTAEASVAADGDGFLAFAARHGAEGAAERFGDFFAQGGGDDAADVVGLEDAG